MKDEKLEFRKKPQEVKKEDLDKVGGGMCNPSVLLEGKNCGNTSKRQHCV